MEFKMKGSAFYGKGNQSPVKQLKEEYMRSPGEKALYSSSEGEDYEPVPKGEIRGIGTYSKYTGPDTTKEGLFGPVSDKKTGEVISTGMRGEDKTKEPTSEKVGPVESDLMVKKKKEALKKAQEKDYFSEEAADAGDAVRDARKYKKKR